MDFKQILVAFLVKSKYVTSDEAAALLDNADATEATIIADLAERDKTRIKAIQTDYHDKGHKKAKSEVLEEFETEIRKAYNIEDATLKGKDLITKIISDQKPQEGAPAELTDEAVKKHPLYISMQDTHKAALKAVKTEWETKYNTLESSQQRAAILSDVRKDIESHFNALNPIFNEDAKIAAKQRALFDREVTEGVEYEKQGNRWVILKDGKVLEDGHGNAIELNDWIQSKASEMFAFKKTDVGGNAGNKNNGGNPDAPTTLKHPIPKNLEEYATFMADKTIPIEERTAVGDVYMSKEAEA